MSSSANPRLRVLLIAPYFDRMTPGESWSTYQWVERITQFTSATVLTSHHEGWDAAKSPIHAEKVVNWKDYMLPRKLARLDYELKPGYFLFYLQSRRWIKQALRRGEKFDLVHQINPLAMRYPCPAAGLGLKLILGPYAGSLKNPPTFDSASTDKVWFRKLRSFDSLRFRRDPWLRRGLTEARLVLGAAPYVKEVLAGVKLRDFAVEGETGVEEVLPTPPRRSDPKNPLRLLYVGRIIRTKGVIDAIKALGKVRSEVPFTLDIVGDGDMMEECQGESLRLGLANQIKFWGRMPRATITEFYLKADLFVFPSFREPSGNVVFEALGCGLPILTTSLGGPGYVVDDSCGVRVNAESPGQLIENLASTILQIERDRGQLTAWSEGAQKRMKSIALWQDKARRLAAHYDRVARTP